MRGYFSPILRLLREAGRKWKQDRADVMAAALAYYSAFSLAPLVMLGVAVSSLHEGAQQSQRFMLVLMETVVGPRGAEAVRPMVESAGRMRHGAWATAVGVVTLVYGGSTLFVHLQTALNVIWDAPVRKKGWLRHHLKKRLFSLLLVGGLPAVLIIGPALSSWLRVMGRSQAGSVALSLLVETALFGFIFKVLPDVVVPWEDVWVGSLFTASLFTLFQTLMGFYLNGVAARSVYGAAGSLVALLVWIHVSAQILLFGAEFVQAYKRERDRLD
jgi:membrane protein